MYIYINYLNNFLIDDKVGINVRTKISFEIVKSTFLGIIAFILFYIMILLKVKSLFGLLKLAKFYKTFL